MVRKGARTSPEWREDTPLEEEGWRVAFALRNPFRRGPTEAETAHGTRRSRDPRAEDNGNGGDRTVCHPLIISVKFSWFPTPSKFPGRCRRPLRPARCLGIRPRSPGVEG